MAENLIKSGYNTLTENNQFHISDIKTSIIVFQTGGFCFESGDLNDIDDVDALYTIPRTVSYCKSPKFSYT